MAGPLVRSLKGRLQGSVFTNTQHGLILKSNNWSKRGRRPATSQARFTQASVASQWRDCTEAVKKSYQGQEWQYPGGSNFNRNQNRQGSTSDNKPY